MNKNDLRFLTFRRWTFILGGLLSAVFAGFYFFNVSAQTEVVEKPAETQNLTLGKLAFSSQVFGPGTPNSHIYTSNPDGSGRVTVPTSQLFPREPAWSPDGTKLAFAHWQSPNDIYVVNANGGGLTNLTNTSDDTQERNPSWSVTGKIAYEHNSQIWIMNEDGSGQQPFPGITHTSVSDPAWSPDGTKLAYTDNTSNARIRVINADGTNSREITAGSDPAWSPDGTKIVFVSGGINIINEDGTNRTNLVSLASGPSWSPDGTKIAYRKHDTNSGIYIMDADGNNQIRIVADVILFPQCCDTVFDYPAWQPVAQTPNTHIISGRVTYGSLPVSGVTVNLSGTVNAAVTTDAVGNYQFSNLPAGGNYKVSPSFLRHYFFPANRSINNLSSDQTGHNFEVLTVCVGGKCVKNGKIAYVHNGEIYTINPDGTNDTNMTNNSASDNAPNYSPDSSNIIFSTDRDGNNEIYRLYLEGSQLPLRLTNNSASDSLPYYSPDGAWIVFVSDRDGNNEIYRMNADGSNQIRLTNEPANDTYPAFSPDGQKIIFISRRSGHEKIYSMNSDGSNQQLLSEGGTFAPCYDRPSYSPDGSKIIFGFSPDCGTMHPSVWTMNADGTNRLGSGNGRFPIYSPDGVNTLSVCCYFSGSAVRMSIGNVNGGTGRTIQRFLNTFDNVLPDWQAFLTPRAPFDFDGDGRSDVSVFRPSNGAWYLLRSSAGLWVPVWGISTDVLVPADYDGDLKTDVAVWRPADGNFYILNSFDGTVRVENFGLAGDVPTGGDWDGDGKADLAVYRGGANGTFYYRGSMGNPNGNITFIPWGVTGDKPVVGDFDGDGRTDAAIYRNGTWWIRQSSNGQASAINFGLAGDRTIPADYDADGKTDIAVFRDGIWYLLRSAQGFTAFQFGISDDVPAPADYDGDGQADAAVYRDGVWWILKSQSGAAEAIPFGLNDDVPVPSAFVR